MPFLQTKPLLKSVGSGPPTWTPPTLETPRLALRALTQRDAPAIFEYASHPDVSRFTLWQPHQSVRDSENFISDHVMVHYQNQEPEPLGIAFNDYVEKVIGTVGCYWISKPSQTMELAYAVSHKHWNRGYATEAVRALINHVFSTYPVFRIQARAKTENQASIRVLEKAGMKHEGTLRSEVLRNGRRWDMAYFSILKDEHARQ